MASAAEPGRIGLDGAGPGSDLSAMCGRFTLTATPEEVAALFALLELEGFPPRYNIPPTEPILSVIATPAYERRLGSNLPDRKPLLVRWGLIPVWAKNPKDLPLLINARAEGVAEKAAFRGAMRHRRALIPASGFYEWKRIGGKVAQAYFVRPRGNGLVGFAGLVEHYMAADGSEIDTGVIITTAANAAMAPIHDRMPVVIRPEDFSRWLDCRGNEPKDVADLLAPVEPDFFEIIPVSPKVNSVANAGPDVQERVEPAVTLPAPAGQQQLDLL